ncbi:hypothetical protein ACK3TF_005521 [Chlorella vulgaris]
MMHASPPALPKLALRPLRLPQATGTAPLASGMRRAPAHGPRRRAAPVRASGGAPPDVAVSLSSTAPRSPRTAAQKEDTWSLEEGSLESVELDQNKEQGRRHMRELSNFTFRRWAFHRSTSRYVRHMSGIFQSRIVRGLAQPLLSVGGTATAVCLYEQALQDGYLPAYFPSLVLPTLPFDITSFALSLLLVFRTNTSYDRWQQAMSAWGDIGTRSRDTLRQLLASSSRTGNGQGGGPAAMLAAASTGRWLVAFSRSLKAQLTEDSDVGAELQGVLTPTEMALLLAANHRPMFVLAVLTELAEAAPLRDSQRNRIDENFTFLEDQLGKCERLLRTPIPLSYTRHTSRFMVIWLSCLPLGLWSACRWGTVPLTIVISFLLLGIEEIGVAIEEPFGILPLEELCRELEFSLSDILEQAVSSKTAAKEAAAATQQAAAALAAASAAAAAEAAAAASAAASTAAAAAADKDAAAAAAAATASSNVAPFVLGTIGLGRSKAASRQAMPASAIFASYDDSEA